MEQTLTAMVVRTPSPRGLGGYPAKYNCYLSGQVKPLNGDPTELRLAAYNAGLGAVQKYDGVPPFPETQNYVKRVSKRPKPSPTTSATSGHKVA